MKVNHYKSLPSTQDVCWNLSQFTDSINTAVVTDDQTSGYGQHNRNWQSEKNQNIAVSYLIHHKSLPVADIFVLNILSSLAIIYCLESMYSQLRLYVKWPNDIYYKDKKLAGILIKNRLANGAIEKSIIGIGININQTQWNKDAPNPTSLKNIVNKTTALSKVLERLTYYIQFFLNKYRAELISDYNNIYNSRLLNLNKWACYKYKNDVHNLKLKNVEIDGHIVFETEDSTTLRTNADLQLIITKS